MSRFVDPDHGVRALMYILPGQRGGRQEGGSLDTSANSIIIIHMLAFDDLVTVVFFFMFLNGIKHGPDGVELGSKLRIS